jgi:hypothetical protein
MPTRSWVWRLPPPMPVCGPIEGGRLTLRPFPTVAVRRLAETIDGLRVAPWPRVYVDLLSAGVRGEEAAEHLREVIHAR